MGIESLPKASDIDEAADAKFGAGMAHGSTLVHEFGHWMGLPHTFGDTECGTDDKIADTLQGTGARPEVWSCFQTDCKTGVLTRFKNWMSVCT